MVNDPVDNQRWWDTPRPWLVGSALVPRRWTRPIGGASYDHDHCQFCSATFSDTVPGALREGFATVDEAMRVCPECFSIQELREQFRLTRGDG
jgi:hypothetical protein